MRLYFATPRYDTPLTRGIMAAAGMRNVLLSYANVAEPRGGFDYWVAGRLEAMRLYVAGNGKSKGSSARDHAFGTVNRLLSYAFHDDWAKEEFAYWIAARPADASVLLDSGAFSAWRLGRAINLDEYCAYLERHAAALAGYIVLDVIKDLAGTQRNYRAMRARGLTPMPVYHSDCEPLSVWEEMLDDNDGYVCLGGLAVDRPQEDLMRARLDRCWRLVEKRWPLKVHGLGVTTQWMLEDYPFYSVDSSGAIVGAGMGRVQRFIKAPGRLAPRDGVLRADGWREDFKRTLDGMVADGVGRTSAAKGKSESAHEGRRVRNIQAQLALERYVTDLWAQRGVAWTD